MGKNCVEGCDRKCCHLHMAHVFILLGKLILMTTFDHPTLRQHFIDESWSNLLNVHAHRNTPTGPTKIGNILSNRVSFNYVECCWTTIKKIARESPLSIKNMFYVASSFLQGELKDLLSQNCFLSHCLFTRTHRGLLLWILNAQSPALRRHFKEKIKMFMKTNSKLNDFK